MNAHSGTSAEHFDYLENGEIEDWQHDDMIDTDEEN